MYLLLKRGKWDKLLGKINEISFQEKSNEMIIMTDLNAKTLKIIKENEMFQGFLEFLEFESKDFLMIYFDVLFKSFLA